MVKKLFYAILVALALVLSAQASAANSTLVTSAVSFGSLKISDSSFYSPYPAQPAGYVDVWIRLQNYGGSSASSVKGTATNIKCELIPKYPLSFDQIDTPIKSAGSLGVFQEALLKYRLLVAADAKQGNAEVQITCTSNENPVSSPFTINIYVAPKESILVVDSAQVVPSQINPGSSGKMVVKLINLASSDLRDVSIKLDLSSSIPIAVENATNEKRIVLFSSGQSMNVDFPIIVYPSADSKVYSIPLLLAYNDDAGNSFSKNLTVSVSVFAQPNLLVSLDKSEVIKTSSTGAVSFDIINNGLSQLKFVTVKLLDSTDFDAVSAKEIYVGNIDSDNTDLIEFTLFVHSDESLVKIPLQISYRDSYNREYVETRFVDLRLYNDAEIAERNLAPVGGSNTVLLAIGAIIVLYVLYRFGYKKLVKKK